MNRFQFLKVEMQGTEEVAYVLDMQSGDVFRSRVKEFTAPTISMPFMVTKNAPVPLGLNTPTPTAPVAVTEKKDPAGDIETPDQRKIRLGGNKVPPAFLGDIRRMQVDPSKSNGVTDVTPHH